MRIMETGVFARVVRFRWNISSPDKETTYTVQLPPPYMENTINLPCTSFTGAMILMDVLNRVTPAPTLKKESFK